MTTATAGIPEKEAIRLTQVWQKYGPNTYPLDLEQLIDGAILTSGFSDQLVVKKQPFESLEGSLVRTHGARKWTILLNSRVSNARRRRFTLGHELGHFMCHREIQERFEDSEDSLNNFHDSIEREANVFAAWLLMPANLLRSEFQSLNWETGTLRDIGNRFECSLQASALRYIQIFKNKPVGFVVSRDGMVLWASKSEKAPFMKSFCFGDELPEASQAAQHKSENEMCIERESVGYAWNDVHPAFESQYFDASGRGYQYTCIEFQ